MESAEPHLIDLRLSLHHLEQLIVVISRAPHPHSHLLRPSPVLADPPDRLTQKGAPVDRLVPQLRASVRSEHGLQHGMLPLEKAKEHK